jgi:hypothetical protein
MACMVNWLLNGGFEKDFEGIGRGLTNVLSRNLSVGTNCNHGNIFQYRRCPGWDSGLDHVPSNFFCSCADLSRKFLHDLTTARHFKSFFLFVICMIIFTTKMEKFQLCGSNSVCAGVVQLLRGRAPAHLRGNIGTRTLRLQFQKGTATPTCSIVAISDISAF